MSYALVTDDAIQSEGGLPASARRLDTQEWVLGLRTAPVATQQACGYFKVATVTRPTDTATDTYDRTLALTLGVPTEVWTRRPMTAAELLGVQQVANRTSIETNLAQDLVAIQAILDSTNANINANPAAAIKDLARALRRDIKHELNDFETE